MQDQLKPSKIEWIAHDDNYLRETQVRKVVDGHMTTIIAYRFPWAKKGKQAAWQRASKMCASNADNTSMRIVIAPKENIG